MVPRIVRTVGVQLAAVTVSVSANQVLSGGRWDMPWLAGTIVLAVSAGGLNWWLETRDGHSHDGLPRPELLPGLAGEDGKPVPIADALPKDLGVHASRFGVEGDGPYIGREADGLLADALTGDAKRLVVVEGPRLAGATRTLAEAARTCLPGHLAAGFFDDPQVPLADMIGQAALWAAAGEADGAVVWLDNLSPDRFTQLARYPLDSLPPGVLVLATLDSQQLEGLRIPELLTILPDQYAARVRLGVITEQERRDLLAEDAYAPLRPLLEEDRDLLMGRVMVVWGPLRAALVLGGSEHAADRVALLRAATDWYRAAIPRLLSPEIVLYLYQGYRREVGGSPAGSPVSVTGLEDALRWATAPADADRLRLIDLQEVAGGRRYAPHPLLAVIADDPGEDVSWPVSGLLWSYADRFFSGDQRRDIGYTALAREACHAAARLLSHDDATIDPAAYNQIADFFYENSEWAASRDWRQRAAITGHPEQAPFAMLKLGDLDREQGDPDQARHWYKQAIAVGNPSWAPYAMINLGALEDEQGNPDQARHWRERAVATGHPAAAPGAMMILGVMEGEQGNPDQARYWYEQAVATGHPYIAPWAMVRLGSLEEEQGNPHRARDWYEEAIATGHGHGQPDIAPMAMVALGILEEEQGNPHRARDWYEQAVATGDPDHAPVAMGNLGILEYEQGNPDRARHWYEETIAAGDPDVAPSAMVRLSTLEREQGNPDQARHWCLEVIATGHSDHAPMAMGNLGILEYEQGNPDQARHWYEQAVATRHRDAAPGAMVGLGFLARKQGNPDEARHWYEQAVATRHRDDMPRAMVGLGDLAREQGNPDQARHWYRQAIATRHPGIASRARQELRALHRHERDQQRGEDFSRYGYLVYADPTLMKREDHSSNSTADQPGSYPEPDRGIPNDDN